MKYPHFSVLIPTGWSIVAVGPGPNFTENLTATPTENVEKDPIHFGVHVRETAPKSIEQKYSELKAKLKAGEKLSFVDWQGERWLLHEHSCSLSTGHEYCWEARAVKGGRLFLMIAATPTFSYETFKAPLSSMMKSIRLHG